MPELREGTPADARLRAETLELIRTRGKQWVDDGIHPALVLLVARDGVVALHEAFGRLGPEPDDPPLTTDALFPLRSQTKPITATCVMMLVEDGLVGLTRSVQEYIPEFQGEGKEAVGVHHLMTHTSGIREADFLAVLARLVPLVLPGLAATTPATDHPATHAALELAYGWPMTREPGREMSYCNINYLLLGEIVRRVSGQSIDDFARARIFDPLGMDDTSYGLPAERDERRVRRSWASHPNPGAAVLELPQLLRPPGALSGPASGWSTAYDTAVFMQAFLNGGTYGGHRLLGHDNVRLMTTNQIPGVPAEMIGERHDEASWGLGWAVAGHERWALFSVMPPGTIFHGGEGLVVSWADPETGVVAAFFSVIAQWRGPLPGDAINTADLFGAMVIAAVAD